MQASVLNHELIDRFSKECLDIFHLKSFVFNQIVSCDNTQNMLPQLRMRNRNKNMFATSSNSNAYEVC